MDVLSLAFALFVVIDSPGNLPVCLHFLEDFSPLQRQKIILREMLIALLLLIFFYFIGPSFLKALNLNFYTVQISGGIILFLMAIRLIFPAIKDATYTVPEDLKDPIVVPIAIPFTAGPGAFAMVILYSKQVAWPTMLGALSLAWLLSLLVMLSGNLLQKLLKHKGLMALERLMGLILILIASQMFLNGISTYLAGNGY